MLNVIYIKSSKPKIAEKDILCYKKVRRLFRDDFCVSEVYHHGYMRGVRQPKIWVSWFKLGDIWTAMFGYRSWDKPILNANAKFVIPAGSKYYYNEQFNEYVSDCIAWVGWI